MTHAAAQAQRLIGLVRAAAYAPRAAAMLLDSSDDVRRGRAPGRQRQFVPRGAQKPRGQARDNPAARTDGRAHSRGTQR
ncbi:hypothetical protein [Amycolatopsis granulosa]|uniref:hypothetical protein n=1 Tax=Amycolatopsis granulosa TaxID=185684 RepID=UPI00141F50A2|nr:hypothetical protein [Amycolatopsis granulosa]NIH87265.1 hypothetical protein [Amycolatopsis granulosa]